MQDFFVNLDKKKLPIILGSVCIAVVVGVIYFLYQQRQGNPIGGGVLIEQGIRESSAEVIKSGDVQSCDRFDQVVDGVNYKIVCLNNIYQNKAIEEGDFSQCDKLDGKLMSVADCNNEVLQKKISGEVGANICSTVPVALRSQCEFLYWSKLGQKDVSACKNMKDARMITSCESSALGSAVSRGEVIDCGIYTSAGVAGDCRAYVGHHCTDIVDPTVRMICK